MSSFTNLIMICCFILATILIFGYIIHHNNTNAEQSLDPYNRNKGITSNTDPISFIIQILPPIFIIIPIIVLGGRYIINYYYNNDDENIQPTISFKIIDIPNLPNQVGDFSARSLTTKKKSTKKTYHYRKKGYWTKTVHDTTSDDWIIYTSNWKQTQLQKGIPQWKKRGDT